MPRRDEDGLPRDHSRYDDHVLPIDPDLSPGDPGEPSVGHHAGPTVHRAREPRVLAAIAVGGFVGTLARYGVGLVWKSPGGHFPWAIFTINASGSFLLGLILTMLLEKPREDRYLRPLLCVGFLGSWTTMSTFAVGSDLLVRRASPLDGDRLRGRHGTGRALTYVARHLHSPRCKNQGALVVLALVVGLAGIGRRGRPLSPGRCGAGQDVRILSVRHVDGQRRRILDSRLGGRARDQIRGSSDC